jgi:electron transfer flavoprotein alpha subunit
MGTDVTVVALATEGAESVPTLDWDVTSVVLINNEAGRLDGLAAQEVLGAFMDGHAPVLLLMPHTGLAVEVAAGLAAAGGYGFGASLQTVSYEGQLTATRTRFGGKVVERLGFDVTRTNVLTIRDGAFPPSPRTSALGAATIRTINANTSVLTRRLDLVIPEVGGVDITKAAFLLAIGRGIGDEANIGRFATLAKNLGATLAASRPLVDVGWIEPARQVGQSGKTVKPKVYLALGISGSIQHVAGMRAADTIIAVNTDASAPIFEIADYGVVMDVNDLADALESDLAIK